jgi:hypothetical protein
MTRHSPVAQIKSHGEDHNDLFMANFSGYNSYRNGII